MKGDTDDLFKAVWSVSGGGIIPTVFDPVEEGFNWLIDVVRGAEDSVVFLDPRRRCWGTLRIGGPGLYGGSKAVSDILVSEGANEHFVDGGEKNLSMSLVGAIVLVEECGGGVESILKFNDLGASGVGWVDGYIAVVDRHNKIDGR